MQFVEELAEHVKHVLSQLWQVLSDVLPQYPAGQGVKHSLE